MKVTFLLPFAGISGGIRVVAVYAERLRRRGHEVTVVSQPHWIRNRRELIKDFFTRRLMMMARGQQEPSFLRHLDIEHRVLDRQRPVTDDDVPDADVVVATWWETAEWCAELSPSKGAKVYFLQGYDAASGQPRQRVDETWRLPLHKIAVSRWLAELARERFDDDDVSLVPNSVDTEQFNAPPRGMQDTPTVGTVYSIKPYRGCAHVFEAVEKAALRIPELRLLSFGVGPEDPSLPVPDCGAYFEMPPQEQLPELYRSCDAWLVGTEVEGFGLPILESFACRTPVIATRAGAAPELLSGGGGMLVDFGDIEQMTDAIIEMIRQPESQWKAMSEQALQTALSYSWEDATNRFEDALRHAIETQNHEPVQT